MNRIGCGLVLGPVSILFVEDTTSVRSKTQVASETICRRIVGNKGAHGNCRARPLTQPA